MALPRRWLAQQRRSLPTAAARSAAWARAAQPIHCPAPRPLQPALQPGAHRHRYRRGLHPLLPRPLPPRQLGARHPLPLARQCRSAAGALRERCSVPSLRHHQWQSEWRVVVGWPAAGRGRRAHALGGPLPGMLPMSCQQPLHAADGEAMTVHQPLRPRRTCPGPS